MKDGNKHVNLNFHKDFVWYFIGSLIPLVIGFIKTPIFTRHFDKESFGELGLVTITFSFLGMFLFSWISSCLWRFYNKYQDSGRLSVLYSNLFFLFLCSMLILGFVSVAWFGHSRNNAIQGLVFYSFFQLVFNQFLVAYLVIIRLKGMSKYYNVFQGLRAMLGLLISLVFVFRFNLQIIALVSSLAIVDAICVIFFTVSNPAKCEVAFSMIRRKVIVEFLKYGSIGLLLNISLLSISYSDRYIIGLFHGIEEIGIYDQVAKISQLSMMALITVYFNTINPTLLRKLEIDHNNALSYVQNYLWNFVFLGLPVVFYLCLFSEEIGHILLGELFRQGIFIMPFIFVATFIHGLSNFFELRLKFSHKFRKLGLIAVSTALLNIGLNVIFIDDFGYQWAAYSTLISYLFMIFILWWSDKQVLSVIWLKKELIIKICITFVIQYLVYLTLVDNFDLLLEMRLVMGIIFASMYFLIFRKHMLKLEMH